MPTQEELQKQVQSTGEDLARIKKDLKRSDIIMTAIIVVLFIGFFGAAVALGGIVTDAFRSREATYQDLVNKINSSNTENSSIIKQVNSDLIKLKNYFGIK